MIVVPHIVLKKLLIEKCTSVMTAPTAPPKRAGKIRAEILPIAKKSKSSLKNVKKR